MGTPYTEDWLPGPSKTLLYTRTYAPISGGPRAVILFIHGCASHIGRYTELYIPLTQHGIAVFAFDQHGYGMTGQDPVKRSKGSVYGKTTWKDQMKDIAWAIKRVKSVFKDMPLFLMGHSLGGTEALGFAAQNATSPHKDVVSFLDGVIATSPLIRQAKPVSKLEKWIGTKVSLLVPYIPIAVPARPEDLSHNTNYNESWARDPHVKPFSSLKILIDTLRHGEALLTTSYKNWPKSLPVLIVHGTADKIASCQASQEFIDKVSASNKKISLFEGCFHALMIEDGKKLVNEVVQIIQTCQALSQGQCPEPPQKSEKSTQTDPIPGYGGILSTGTCCQ